MRGNALLVAIVGASACASVRASEGTRLASTERAGLMQETPSAPSGHGNENGDASPAAAASPPQEVGLEMQQAVAEALADHLAREYVDPPMGLRLAAAARSQVAPGAAVPLEASAFAERLMQRLRAVYDDKHLSVFYTADPPPPSRGSGPPPRELVEQLRKIHGAIVKIEILDGNVGYLDVRGVPMLEASKNAIAGAFAFLHETDALIIDNRQNQGGDPDTVALYLSYLTEAPTVVYHRIYSRDGQVDEYSTLDLGALSYGRSKPVYVLTSRETLSGGEGLSYHLQALKRAVLVGEVTMGGGRRMRVRALGHDFYAAIPYAQGKSAITGSSWEGTGVHPDIDVPADQALSVAHRAALERLGESEPEPEAR